MKKSLLTTFVLIVTSIPPRFVLAEPLDSDTLRVEKSWHLLWGYRDKIVSGDETLFILGMFPSREPASLFEQRSVDASELYLKYHQMQSRSSWVLLGGTTILFIGAITLGTSGNDQDLKADIGAGVFLGGLAVILGSMVVGTIADRTLLKSVAVYNRSLRTAPAYPSLRPTPSERRRE